jgi:hypothetical protein
MEGNVVGGEVSVSGVTDLPRNLEITYSLRPARYPAL